jgi:hypothetical protein
MLAVVDVDMALKGPGSFGIGDIHRGVPAMIFMRGEADGVIRISGSKNETRSSRSFWEVPPLEQMTGLRVLAIFSINGQSLMSELAILMIGNPSSTHNSTDLSSNGVAIGMPPDLRMDSTILS